MTGRAEAELALLRARYPDLETIEDGQWVRIPGYPVPGSLWTNRRAAVAFQIPPTVAQEPYGFYVPRVLRLRTGEAIGSWTAEAATPFAGEWAKFSWNITWQPAAEIMAGTTMLDFVGSFADRLREGP